MAKKAKAEEPAKRNPECLQIDGRYVRQGEAEKLTGATDAELVAFNDKLTARALSQPEVRAARTIQRFEGENLDINAAADELRELVAEVQGGSMKRPEAMLVAQAHALDALFSSLAMRSHANSREGYLEAADRYLRLALKAQAQAVRTIEALGELKNPRPVTFVRQANVATNQQVNNGMPSQAGSFENQRTKQTGETYELCQDTGTPSLESRVNPALETVGEKHRAEVPRG